MSKQDARIVYFLTKYSIFTKMSEFFAKGTIKSGLLRRYIKIPLGHTPY